MSDEYNKFLQEIHSKNFTTDEVIDDVVKEATGAKIKSKTRFVSGEVNEVYDVELEGKENVVVRIYKSDEPIFLEEKWAIEQCKSVGVPVPSVILIKHISEPDGILSFCVQEKLRGDTVERGKVKMWDIDRDQLKAVMLKSGELLAKMHTIPVEGFGDLNEYGKAEHKSFVEQMLGRPERAMRHMDIARELNIPDEQIKRAADILVERTAKYKDVKPTFNHGDFSPKHIMYEGTEVTGILDFGDIQSHAPIFDFARWEYWYGDTDILKWLKEGFTDKSVFDDDYEELSNLIQLNMSLGTIWHYHTRRKYEQGVKEGIKKLNEILSRFS
ncbi:MAG: aminoglycoside phosphotransferase family protein [Parcubacteria group bacterium]|nr:aminoglycoside phosphotransferase family protein [Parcubacteria group bacterium]